MIRDLTLSNYKSIRNLSEFPIGPLTVLIGPNRSGKTNLIDFFSWLSDAGRQELTVGLNRRGGLGSVLWAGGAEAVEFSITFGPEGLFREEEVPVDYLVEVQRRAQAHTISREILRKAPKKGYQTGLTILDVVSGTTKVHNLLSRNNEEMSLSDIELAAVQVRDPIAYPTPGKVRQSLASIVCHRPFVTHDQAPMRQAQLIQSGTPERPATRLLPGGDNLSNVYYHLKNDPRWRDTWQEIEYVLKNAFPGFDQLYFPAEAGHGRIILGWQDKFFPKRGFSASMFSDGMLAFLCLLAVLYDPEPPALICIDEPEVGLHPSLTNLVAELLQEGAERTQIVVATHSPQLITHLKPEHVVVVESESGESIYRRLDPSALGVWLKDFSLGELWLQGELGGKS